MATSPVVGADGKVETIRFRVTQDELDTIMMAAREDAIELEKEYQKRGLPGSGASGLRSPHEWARQAVIARARERLRDRGLKLPHERRAEEEKKRAEEAKKKAGK